jgi:hypothetical protein
MPSVYAFTCGSFSVVALMTALPKVMAFDVPLIIVTLLNVTPFDVPPLMATLLSDETNVITSLIFVPSLNTIELRPAGSVNVVPVAPEFDPLAITTGKVKVLLLIRYCFSIAG